MGNDEPVKRDEGKLPFHLWSYDAFEETTKVLQFGAGKYAEWNWADGSGFEYHRVFRALVGHIWDWWRGQDLDEETGLHHLAHAMCCVMFLLHFVLNKERYNLDDRPIQYYPTANKIEQPSADNQGSSPENSGKPSATGVRVDSPRSRNAKNVSGRRSRKTTSRVGQSVRGRKR